MFRPILLSAMLAVSGVALAPSTPAMAQAKKEIGKKEFVNTVAIVNLFEVQSGKLALSRSNDPDIKALAKHLVEDHSAATKKLQSAAGMPLPTSLDSQRSAMLKKLEAAKGQEFDRLFLTMQAQAHKEAIDLFQTYAKAGDDPQLKKFASETLPKLKEHLDHVQKAQKS